MEKTFSLVLATIVGSMIGAGILVTPGRIMPYGFAGVLGWLLAAACSFILGNIFANNSVAKPDKQESPAVACTNVYGYIAGVMTAMSQWLYIALASCVVIMTFLKYLIEFISPILIGIETLIGFSSGGSHIITLFNNSPDFLINSCKFIVCSFMIVGILFMHSRTTKALKILSALTWFKIVIFGCLAIVGLITFNYNKVFNSPESTSFTSAFYNGFAKVSIRDVLTTCTIALFAFAGLESGTADPKSVADAKRTIPSATRWAIAISAFIFILIQIMCINVLDPTVTYQTPVKTAIEVLLTGKVSESMVAIIGIALSLIAMTSCLGTVIALLFVSPKILTDAILIVRPDLDHKIQQTKRTHFPIVPAIITGAFCCVALWIGYFLTDNVFDVYAYCICQVYITPILVSLRRTKSTNAIMLNCIGLMACLILFAGCDRKVIMYGLIWQIIVIIVAFFARLQMQKNSEPRV